MYLLIAATQNEMEAFSTVAIVDKAHLHTLVTGVGPVETTLSLSRFLDRHHTKIQSVVNFGIGGAYVSGQKNQIGLLDICLAEREVLGDFGVCFGNRMEPFAEGDFPISTVFELDEALLRCAEAALSEEHATAHTGTFVTVNAASGTRERGEHLSAAYGALCENMEGAAAARVCEAYDLPFLEVRAISNLVEDRPGNRWKIDEACSRAAWAAALIISNMQENR